MKFIYTLLFSLVLVSCDKNEQCDDCDTKLVKYIMVLDSNNNNLIFGETSIYNSENLKLKSDNQSTERIWINDKTKTIDFLLKDEITTYYFFLNETEIDTISFDLMEKKDPSCCGNITFSEKTFLNGEAISNSDTIRIIKPSR